MDLHYLSIAQYMAAAAFFAVAATHLFVWVRAHRVTVHLFFAFTAAAAGANAIAEEQMYRANDLQQMSGALRAYVTTSGCWAIATVCFIAAYAQVGKLGRYVSYAIVTTCVLAIALNFLSPASFLYTELTGLREIKLPWGETIRLVIGTDNPLRLLPELAWIAVIGVGADGSYRFWIRGQKLRAMLFGLSVVAFMACFGTHAYFVDSGQLNSAYLSTYGFLALVALMSYDLAGDVMRMEQLSTQLEQKETELVTAVAEERNRIARDLHDSVTQTLFSTAAIADALPAVWERRPEEALRGLNDLKHLTRGALAEMRTLLLELRPATLTERPLGELLEQLGTSASGRMRIPVDVEIRGQRRFPDDVQIAFYRTAQEALHNVAKHADASRVQVQLDCNDRSALLTIQDDGCGWKRSTNSGMGLEIMRERIQTISGTLDIKSEPGAGTIVLVRWSDDQSVKS